MKDYTRFDWHDWDPELCSTPEEVDKVLRQYEIFDKPIASIRVIGAAEGKKWLTPAERKDQKRLLWNLWAWEPTVITFADGSFLEIQMRSGGQLLVSVGQISPDLVDGLNDVNFDADTYFSILKGRKIIGISWCVEDDGSRPKKKSYLSARKGMTLELGDDLRFYLRQQPTTNRGEYEIGIMEPASWMQGYWRVASVPESWYYDCIKPVRQILIDEGHNSGGSFWIMPVKQDPDPCNAMGAKEYRAEEISIDESDIGDYLYWFLMDHFDPAMQKSFRQHGCCASLTDFEWNLEYNVFTYKSIRKMLQKIRRMTNLLEKDYDNPQLDSLKENFSVHALVPYLRWDTTESEYPRLIKENIGQVLHFYRRFCNRMERMMEHAPDYSLISFMGP